MLIQEKELKAALESCKQLLLNLYEEREAQLICSWIMEEITGVKQHLFRMENRQLSESERMVLNEMMGRLLHHEPVQYVLGYAHFRKFKLHVNANTLIPRPETEELVGHVLQHLQTSSLPLRVIDIGTGSGCIAISIKDEMPRTAVFALDVSQPALHLARNNAVSCGTDINFICCDFLMENEMLQLPQVDVIVSNPPYITKAEEQLLDKHVSKFEPSQALFVPDHDPLLYYRQLAAYASRQKAVWLFTEVHENHAQQTAALYNKAGAKQTQVLSDLQGKERIVKCLFDSQTVFNNPTNL